MPIDYKDYPADWKQIRERILKRAGDQCERCGVKNHAFGYRDQEGLFIELYGMELEAAELDGDKVLMIVLTIAHLNHIKEDCRDENLQALCQKCHLNYDLKRHIANRKYGKRKDQLNINFEMED